MATIASMMVRIGADVSNFVGGLDRMKKELDDTLGASLETSRKVSVGFGLVGAGMLALGVKAVSMAGELEQSKVAFETMLGSAEQADIFLRQLQSFAAKTPFELKGLQDSSKLLLAFGFRANEIIPMMTSVGNAISAVGGGAEAIEGVTRSLGKMKAKGKVSSEEMTIMAEKGIPVWQMLSEKIGKSVPEAMKLAEKGAISADVGISAVLEGMDKRWTGMMDRQSKTLLGAWSNLQDGISRTLTLIGGEIATKLDLGSTIAGVASALSGFADAIQSSGLGGAIDTIFSPAAQMAILGIAGAITGMLVPSLMSASVGFAAALAPMAPFLAGGAAIGALAFVIYRNWGDISYFFRNLWQDAGNGLTWLFNAFRERFSGIGNIVGGAVKWIADRLGALWGLIPEGARKAMGGLGSAVSSGIGSAVSFFQTAPAKALPALQALAGGAEKALQKTGDASAKAAEATKKHADKIADIYTKASSSMAGLEQKAKLSGGDMSIAAEKANLLKGVLVDLAENGADKTSAKFRKLTEDYKRFSDLAKAEDIAAMWKNAEDQLNAIVRKQRVFGDAIDGNAESARVLQAVLEQAMEKGIGNGNKQFDAFLAKWEKFSRNAKTAKLAPKEFDISASMSDYAKQLSAIDNEASKFGGMDVFKAKSDLMLSQLKKLTAEGKDNTEAFRLLKANYDDLQGSADALPSKLKDLNSAFSSLRNGAGDVAALFGVELPSGLDAPFQKVSSVAYAFDNLSTGISKIGPAFDAVKGPMGNFIAGIAGPVMGALSSLGGAIVGFMAPALGALGGAFMAAVGPAIAFAAALMANPLTWIILGIVGVIAGLGLLARNWDKVMAGMRDAWKWTVNGLGNLWNGAINGIKATFGAVVSAFKAAGQGIAAAWGAITSGIRALWKNTWGFIKGFLDLMLDGINVILRGLGLIKSSVPGGNSPVVQPSTPQLANSPMIKPGMIPVMSSLPRLAAGGVTTGPVVAEIGEAGTEAILPLDDRTLDRLAEAIVSALGRVLPTQQASGGNTVIINTPYAGDSAARRALARMVGVELEKMAQGASA